MRKTRKSEDHVMSECNDQFIEGNSYFGFKCLDAL